MIHIGYIARLPAYLDRGLTGPHNLPFLTLLLSLLAAEMDGQAESVEAAGCDWTV